MSVVTTAALGALPRPSGRTQFWVWAPNAGSVAVRLEADDHALSAAGDKISAGEISATPGDEAVELDA